MDIDKATNQVEKADGLLTSLGRLIKKHWLLLLFIGVAWFLWYAITTPLEEIEAGENYYNEGY